jgi:transketolase
VAQAVTSLDSLCINVVRGLSMDAVQRANSGHPGMPMGAAPMAFALWQNHLRHNPADPKWFNRDRFILSAGHGSMLLYSLLHLTGYDLSLDEIQNFRQWGSRTPGHPENHLTPGVEMATGPLGQGVATSVGFALAERYLGTLLNDSEFEVVDHMTYVICSDGDLMEGIGREAASLAGTLQLGKLVWLYDSNQISIDGSTELSFTEDSATVFAGLGWHVQRVDGMNPDAVTRAIAEARLESTKPSLIICETTIGYGSPNKAGSSKSHGAPLGVEEVRLSKEALGLPADQDFYIPDDVRAAMSAVQRGASDQAEWTDLVARYRAARPERAKLLDSVLMDELADGWDASLPSFDAAIATRNASEKVLNAIATSAPNFVSGCADLADSVKTMLHGLGAQSATTPHGRNVFYGVREHAMAAAVNGLTLHGGMRAIGGTFLIFTDYCKPSLRLAALMQCPSVFAFSHDSIGLGEDGPTHQPVEQLMALRGIPNFNVMRPADGNETAACWRIALQLEETPSAVILSRQDLPAVSPSPNNEHPAQRGGYVLRDSADAKVTLIATGSEVGLALSTADLLGADGISSRVVNLPSWFLFEKQPPSYRAEVLGSQPRVSIEAGLTLGWQKYSELQIGLDHFGASAPGPTLFREFGFTPEAIAARVKALLA